MAPTFDGISLAAKDLAATLAFYRTLGLDFPPEADKEPHAEAQTLGGFRLMFDSHDSLKSLFPGWTPGDPNGSGSLAFRCESPAEVDTAYAAVIGAGHHGEKEPWDAVWGQRYASVVDPDGRSVDLFAWLNK